MKEIKSRKIEKSLVQFKKDAEAQGYADNFLFVSTLNRLEVQIKIMQNMEESMENDGTLVTKEYVKGRANLYTSPAVATYNKTCQQANNTTQTLMKVIEALGGVLHEEDEDDEL